MIGRSACIFYGRTDPAYNWPLASIFYGRTGLDGRTDGRMGFLQERAEVGASPSSGFLLCAWVPRGSSGFLLCAWIPNRTLGLLWKRWGAGTGINISRICWKKEEKGIRLQFFRFFGGWVWSEGEKKGRHGWIVSDHHRHPLVSIKRG